MSIAGIISSLQAEDKRQKGFTDLAEGAGWAETLMTSLENAPNQVGEMVEGVVELAQNPEVLSDLTDEEKRNAMIEQALANVKEILTDERKLKEYISRSPLDVTGAGVLATKGAKVLAPKAAEKVEESLKNQGLMPAMAPDSKKVYRSSSKGDYTEFDPTKQRSATLGKGTYVFTDKDKAKDWTGEHLQEIDVPNDIMEKSINWGDGGQSAFVTKAFEDIKKEVDFDLDLTDDGIDVYPTLVEHLGEKKAQALLQKHGIKGNRRGEELNVFNPEDLDIVKTTSKGILDEL